MTSTVTAVTIAATASGTVGALPTALGAIAVLLLIVLLVLKELVRAFGGPRSTQALCALDVAIVPLLLVFGLLVTQRFARLLPTL